MLIGLAEIGHNLIIWLRNQLSQAQVGQVGAKVAEYGIKRWVRDWLGLKGQLSFKGGRIVKVPGPKRHELSRQFKTVLVGWASQSGVRLILYQT